MSEQLQQDQEPFVAAYTPPSTIQEPMQTGTEAVHQESHGEVEDIRELLRYVADKPMSLPWGVIACVSAPSFYTLYNMSLLFHQTVPGMRGTVHFSVWSWLFSALLGALVPAAYISYITATRKEQRADADIGPLDVRWIGGLIEALDDENRRVRVLAKRLLARLLSRFKASDAALLTPALRQVLYARLRQTSRTDTDLILGILRAIERTGDLEAVPYIEALVESRGVLPHQRRIRRAALACLASLERRFGMQYLANYGGPSLQQQDITAVGETPQTTRGTANPKVVELVEKLKEHRRTNGQPALRRPFLIAAWVMIAPYIAYNIVQSMLDNQWFSAGAWGIGLCLVIQLHRSVLSPHLTKATRELAACNDIQGVGILAEALEWPDPEIQSVASASLTLLLPRLQATDTELLNAEQRACLHRRLTMNYAVHDSQLTLAILKALQQVGDARSVPYVERLANSLPLTPLRRKIRQAAVDCLPFLTSRIALQQASETLLRASSAENSDPTLLLRAADEMNTSDPGLLLRASAGSEPAS